MKPSPNFNIKDVVRRCSSPDQVGVITVARWNAQLRTWNYGVRFGAGTRGVQEIDLELLPSEGDPVNELTSGRFGSAEAFRLTLTFERLAQPPSRIKTAFGSAKAKLLPFQFKPLLKFLESGTQRLLIADDVGLGKTIEAGYIFRELSARQHLDRVLIVVPSRLRMKWRAELSRRFDEHFDIVKMSEIRAFLQSAVPLEKLPNFRWITSLEGLRNQELIHLANERLLPIDLVIFDEAHRLRNTGTLQNKIGAAFTQSADAALFLTATPVQTHQDDLFNLLTLLDNDVFNQRDVFNEQLKAQKHALRCIRNLRDRPPAIDNAAVSFETFLKEPSNRLIAESEFGQDLIGRIKSADELNRPGMVDLQRDLSELCLTSSIISRTRKADVLTDRPRRVAHSVVVTLSESEQRVYDGVAGLVSRTSGSTSGWGHSMALLMAYRYTASCIPAAMDYFRARGLGTREILDGIGRETEDESGWMQPTEKMSPETNYAGIEGLLPTKSALPTDSKLKELIKTLDNIWREDDSVGRPRRKVILFAFFKRTLHYLRRVLEERKISSLLIDGDVKIADRETTIEEFRASSKSRILLSSEVGSEGLDLQFASVVINYDLPWNPMVLEQRIGRIDRIGQLSDRIVVVNFAVRKSVEERILLRLYERIGIFEDTLGEIDPILGEKIEKITINALTGRLTEREIEEKTDELANSTIENLRETRRLGDSADTLIAADQAFLDEVDALMGGRKIPSSAELYQFVRTFLSREYLGSRLPDSTISAVGQAILPSDIANDLETLSKNRSECQRFASAVRFANGKVQLTFDSSAILEHARAELIHHRHPLVLLALEAIGRESFGEFCVFGLHLENSSKGRFLFQVVFFDIKGSRPRLDLVPLFFDLERLKLVSKDEAENLWGEMVDKAGELGSIPEVDEMTAITALETLGEETQRQLAEISMREDRINLLRGQRRRTTIEATLKSKADAARRRLEGLQASGVPNFPLRMAKSNLDKRVNELEAFLKTTRDAPKLVVDHRVVATGLLNCERE